MCLDLGRSRDCHDDDHAPFWPVDLLSCLLGEDRKTGSRRSPFHTPQWCAKTVIGPTFYRRRFVSTRLAATLLADGVPCFAI